jgi:cell wall-associated NlpC family hydrolase
MVKRSDFVKEARTWIGTPYRPGGAVKGVGCNCYGFFAGTARICGLGHYVESFRRLEGFKRLPEPLAVLRALRATLEPVRGELKEGDLLLMKMGGYNHVAIYSGNGMCIQSSPHTVAVAEQRLLEYHSAWRIPELTD